jgi:hypothetical protein
MFWYMLAHYDRYLQTLVPLMAAATAATLGRVWLLGPQARVAVVCLVSLQVVWGNKNKNFHHLLNLISQML